MRTSTPDPQPDGEFGFASLSHVVAATLALWFFAVLANLIVIQYASGVVRIAIDEGARRGALVGAGADECALAIDDALTDLLGGSYGRDVHHTCTEEAGWMRVTAEATFSGFVPPLPDVTRTFEARVADEDVPGVEP
jgi:hypothetical protein